jgi:hypothetical protein
VTDSAYVMVLVRSLTSKKATMLRNELLGKLANNMLMCNVLTTHWHTCAKALCSDALTANNTVIATTFNGLVQCHNCGGIGHLQCKCPLPKSTRNKAVMKELITAFMCAQGCGKPVPQAFLSLATYAPLHTLFLLAPSCPMVYKACPLATSKPKRGLLRMPMAAAAQIEINSVVYVPMLVPTAATKHNKEEEQYSKAESTAWSLYTVGTAHIVNKDLGLMVLLLENPLPAITIQDANSSNTWRFEELDSKEEHALTTNKVTVCHVGTADWFLNSGAAMHCTLDKEDLVNIRAICPVPIHGISSA